MTQKVVSSGDFIIIGLTGPFGSGCTTVAEILSDSAAHRKGAKYGFKHIKLSDILKAEAKKQKIDIENMDASKRRNKLQDIGNELRKKHGYGVLVRMALEEARKQNADFLVIESIKNPGEVIELKKSPNAYLMAIDAPYDIRWNRLRDVIYQGDQHQFDLDDKRDRNEGIEGGQNVQKCVDLADIFITNDDDIDSSIDWKNFKKTKLDRYINLLKKPGSEEPTTMELMMNDAYCTSLLSACLKRQVGALITVAQISNKPSSPGASQIKSKEYVIATGYNAVPEGELCCEAKYEECFRDRTFRETFQKLKHCPACGVKQSTNSATCSSCGVEFNQFHPSKALDLCRSLHAEENAILQTARLGGGISLIGTTLYTTTFPCLLCANKILATGIERIIWLEAYPDKQSMQLLKEASKRGVIELIEFEGVKAESFYKLFNKKHEF